MLYVEVCSPEYVLVSFRCKRLVYAQFHRAEKEPQQSIIDGKTSVHQGQQRDAGELDQDREPLQRPQLFLIYKAREQRRITGTVAMMTLPVADDTVAVPD
jgi:hypothetical protein